MQPFTSPAPTLDDILRLFQETDRIIKESQKESERKAQENERKAQENERKSQENERLFKEKQQETERLFKEKQQETERIIKESQQETDRKFQEMTIAIKAVNSSIGKLGNRLGEFVEEAVRPSAVRLFREVGIDVHEVQQNIIAQRNGESLELDLLVVNDNDAVAIECKSNLSVDDVNEHLARLDKIKRVLPRYKDNRILGAVAGMVIPGQVAQYAIRKGLYVIGQNGDHLELRNTPVFVAKAW
ncbi:MAG: DUF3782 domain-containing protein [Methylobacter sp.]|nr:DUF3782 domain-containing protein [Methylobacter sp.]MDP2099371.1 DUF3782 domain-containing protein [Methylobacter sp.]MDP2427307.1 DUF3782 domain-containing protein [Methylobacter sp.]MDP3054886.1 DUF3782 domain-containing protein [Methylobacter sp.]MDP3364106.1 DUF3782 domain-containing protein [Methylobacter sp.]